MLIEICRIAAYLQLRLQAEGQFFNTADLNDRIGQAMQRARSLVDALEPQKKANALAAISTIERAMSQRIVDPEQLQRVTNEVETALGLLQL